MISTRISELFELSKDVEKEMWTNAVVVFDSSALLNFYDIPEQTRNKIYKTFETALKNRLLLPGQVQFEYLKNRKKTIFAPLTDEGKSITYKSIESTYLAGINSEKTNINNSLKRIFKFLDELKDATKKSDRHPHFSEDLFSDMKTHISDFENSFKTLDKENSNFQKSIRDQLKKVKKEIQNLEKSDDVLKAINKHFILKDDFTYSQKIELGKKARERYEDSIPPGYEDYEKPGLQKYGDYFIWNQILDYAKESDKDIIFICDDITKNDWCIQDKKEKGRIAYPRHELSKEFHEFTGKRFWMYSLNQWAFYANKYLDTNLNTESFKVESFVPNYRKMITTMSLKSIKKNYRKKQVITSLRFLIGSFHLLSEEERELVLKNINFTIRNIFSEKKRLKYDLNFAENDFQKVALKDELDRMESELKGYTNLLNMMDRNGESREEDFFD